MLKLRCTGEEEVVAHFKYYSGVLPDLFKNVRELKEHTR
jgi:hypothetical protein